MRAQRVLATFAVAAATLVAVPAYADPPVVTIADVQGTGEASPLDGQTVTTRGVVTAAYPTGGFNGLYLQTAGTGGDVSSHESSDGLFIFSSALASEAEVGDHLDVTGRVSEFRGLTEITPSAGSWTVLDEPAEAVKPADVDFPLTEAQRESFEGMLLQPSGEYTITNNFTTNQFAEIGLAAGDEPLPQPTNIVRPGTAAYDDVVADNARRLVTLDDGASVNFNSSANKGTPLPWLRPDNEVRVGAPTSFTAPMVLDFRNDLWKLQPTDQLKAGEAEPVTFGDTREAAPENVGGLVQIATFNVLNYFTTLGEDYAASGAGTCTYFRDRAGVNVTVNSCTNNGPRGAANAENLKRQQDKIVAAINSLGADVVSLEEIENSAAFGIDRDTALRHLVDALNADAGAGTWAHVASPTRVPEAEDVIRTAFIYRTDTVRTIRESTILDDPAFGNARDPLAQEFRPLDAGSKNDFVVIVNHFKSKSSGSGEDADQGDGQGRVERLPGEAGQGARGVRRGPRRGGQDRQRVPHRRLQRLQRRGPGRGHRGRRLRQRPARAHRLRDLPVRRAGRLARPRLRLTRGVRPGHRRRHLEHQRLRVGRTRVQPVQQQRHEPLRARPVPRQRSRPGDRRLRHADHRLI